MSETKLRRFRSLIAKALRQALEKPLYTLAMRTYRLGIAVASLRLPKAKKMLAGRKETFRRLADKINPNDKNIWVHAASLGEFEQGRPLIEELRRRNPEYKIVLSFFSPSGYEVRHNWEGADCVVYLPFDTPRNARRMINAINPEKVFFVKYEIWRNMLEELQKRAVPTYLISAAFTPKQKFFRRSCRWYSLWLRWFTHIFVQDERSRRLLEGIGITDVTIAGDTRFDRVTDIMRSTRSIPELEALKESAGDAPLLMVGSSWEADEERYMPWLIQAKGRVKAVIAPHEFSPKRLEIMQQKLAPLNSVLFTEINGDLNKAAAADVVIMNCFGLLSSAYRYADIAYVGGGFGAGIHNINEAAVYGIPVIYGPNNSRFIEARELADAGGGFSINNATEIADILNTMTSDADKRHDSGTKAGEYIKSRLGATNRILDSLRI